LADDIEAKIMVYGCMGDDFECTPGDPYVSSGNLRSLVSG